MNLEKYLINSDYVPAIEADDITKEVQDQMNDSKISKVDSNETSDNTNTDILGAVSDEIEEKSTTDTTQNSEADDDSDDANTDIDETEDEDELDDEDREDELEESNDDTSSTFLKKNNLRDSLILLHNITVANIKYLSELSTDINDSEKSIVISKSINYLTHIKKYTNNIITNEIKKAEYSEVLSKYIMLKNVYDLNVEMLEKAFKQSSNNLKGKVKKIKSRK